GTQVQKATGMKIGMNQTAAGEAMAQVAAERANPKVDVWYTGSGDPHLQAAELGLTEEYRSPMLSQLHEWAVRQAEQSKYHTVGVYTGALGIGYNPEILAKRKLPEPKCWADLANPIYRDEVQMANPNASGTAYATIATFVQIFGEDKAFELLKGMHRNIKNYQTPSNKAAPAPPGAPKMDEIKLINYDFAKYGSAVERKRLLEKWDREVAAMPR